MATKLENKTNVDAPSAGFQYGNIKDNSGLNDGTPVDKAVYADFHQFFARMLDQSASVVANGLPESTTNGYQYFESLQEIIATYKNTLLYTSSHTLTSADIGCLVSYLSSSAGTFTLPLTDPVNYYKKTKFFNWSTGQLTIATNVAEGFFPTTPLTTIVLNVGDFCEITSFAGAWFYEITRRPIDTITYTSSQTLTSIVMDRNLFYNSVIAGTFTLPLINASLYNKSTTIYNLGTAALTVVPNASDAYFPSPNTVILYAGDFLELICRPGIWLYKISRNKVSFFQTNVSGITISNPTGATISGATYTVPISGYYKFKFTGNATWAITSISNDGTTLFLYNTTTSTNLAANTVSHLAYSFSVGTPNIQMNINLEFNVFVLAGQIIDLYGRRDGSANISLSGYFLVEKIN